MAEGAVTQFLPIILAGFAAALGLTPMTRQLARRLGVMDQPSSRKVHTEATPLLGGLAIYGGMVLSLLLFSPHAHFVELLAIMAGASWLAVVGFVDDRRELAPWKKFAAQFLAGGGLVLAGVGVQITALPLINALLTVLWVVGITNAVNFLDNMDGLAAGLTAIAAGFFFLLAVLEGQGLVASLAAALFGASVGFLIFNFNPASTFMGDMGSLVLGFTLAVLAIKLRFQSPLSISTWSVPLLVVGLPLFDISLVMFTRLREGRAPWQAGKDHTSHRLVQMGLSMRRAVLVLYAACVALGGLAVVVSRADAATASVILLLAAGAALACFVWLERFRIHYLRAQQDASPPTN